MLSIIAHSITHGHRRELDGNHTQAALIAAHRCGYTDAVRSVRTVSEVTIHQTDILRNPETGRRLWVTVAIPMEGHYLTIPVTTVEVM